jgi:hypothetical protein
MENLQKSPKIFECVACQYKCTKKSEWQKHISTRKHINRTELNEKSPEKNCCRFCNKEYKAKNSLWYHEKKCTASRDKLLVSEPSTNLVVELLQQNQELIAKQTETLKQNQELQTQLIELAKERTVTNNTTNTTQFNIHFYLNETCKNAINYNDLIGLIQLTQADLQKVVENGYVKGHSLLIQELLDKLDVHERPIQCSDPKRGVTHIKNDNKWQIEDKDMRHIKKLTDTVTHKTIQEYCKWAHDNPPPTKTDFITNEVVNNEKYKDAKEKHTILQLHVMSQINGIGCETEKNDKEIHKNVIKMVTIRKRNG